MRNMVPVLFAGLAAFLISFPAAPSADDEPPDKDNSFWDGARSRGGLRKSGAVVDVTNTGKKKNAEPIAIAKDGDKEGKGSGGFWKDALWVGGGAVVGGLIGFMLGGPIGAVFGAVLGGAGGYFLKGMF